MLPGEIPGRSRLELLGRRRGAGCVFRNGWRQCVTKVNHFYNGSRFAYLYDMGDYWEHEVRIEQFLDRNPKKTYPVCTGGSRVCPPEDCGGSAGYLEWREEAMGYEAWSDLDLVVGFAVDVVEGRSVGKLTDDDRETIQDALDRMAARRPFLQTTFYRRVVNEAFRAGCHLQMMHQQLI